MASITDQDKHAFLINFLSADVYNYVSAASGFADTITTLKKRCVKPKNEVFARHLLATRKQEPGENVDQFSQQLLHLSKDCQFKAVTADDHRNRYIRDLFISLQETLQQVRSLESAQTHASLYVDSSKSTLPEPQACASTE